MLPRVHRLRSSGDFRRVYERSRSFTSPSGTLVIRMRRRHDQNPARVGVVVGTKVSKKATDRNKLRRRIREIVRTSGALSLRGVDIVILTRTAALRGTFIQLRAECMATLSKLYGK